MDVTVCVGTFGNLSWSEMARSAIGSVPEGVPVIHSHRDSLAEARNASLDQVTTEFAIHLDADDRLDPGYIEAMEKGSADLRGPSIQQWRGASPLSEPFVPRVYNHHHDCTADCLRFGNWLVVGACVRTELARSVGGWEEWGWSEDWALWARCWEAGGTVEAIPEAVYHATWRKRSRNKVTHEEGLKWHRAIEEAVWG